MTSDVDATQWSLPGPAETPKDELKVQMEVYKETILLRGFDGDSTWVRTVSADEIANALTRHLGFSSGLLPQEALWWNQGETGHSVAPVEAAAGVAGGPAKGGVQASRKAQASHAGPGLRLLAGPCALGLRRTGQAHRPRRAALPGTGLQCLRRREGLPRKPPVPGKRSDRYRSPSSDPSSRLPEIRGTARRNTPTTCKRYGRSSMEQLHTRLKTLFPSVRWPTRWRSPRGDVATASAGPGPVGYLVNHPGGLSGAHGVGYDYVLGSGGVYVQSENAHLTARVPVAPGSVRGTGTRRREGGAVPRSHPGKALRGGAALVPGCAGHGAVLRRALGRGRLPAGGAPAGRDSIVPRLPAPCRCGRRVPLSRRLPRLLLGHRRPGRAGLPNLRRRGTPRHFPARVESPGRGLRPLRPGGLAPGVRRPGPGPPRW